MADIGPQSSALASSTMDVHYIHHVGWSGAKRAAFSYREPSIVRVTFSYDKRQEIGLWSSPVSKERLEDAQTALRASRYKDLAPSDPMPPETKFVSFEEQLVGDDARDMTSFPLNALPPAILPVRYDQKLWIGRVRKAAYPSG